MTDSSPTRDLVSRADRIARLRGPLWRGAVAVAILTLVVLGAAACAGGSSNSSASSTVGTTDAPGGGPGSSGAPSGFLQQAVQYSQCMRAHGVTKYPDPPANGGPQSINPAGIDTNSPTYKEAAQACQKYSPPNAGVDPNQQAQAQNQQLKYARCMRSHGITKFPDPNNGGGKQSLSQYGIDTNSPAFKAANKACESLLGAGSNGG